MVLQYLCRQGGGEVKEQAGGGVGEGIREQVGGGVGEGIREQCSANQQPISTLRNCIKFRL